MALGDTYNNNAGSTNSGNKEEFSATVRSGYGFTNPDSKVDPTAINFSFWKGLLKISIAPKLTGENGYDQKNALSIHLTPAKAQVLLREIEEFEQNPSAFKNYGVVNTKGSTFVAICDGTIYGSDSPCIVMKSIAEDGTSNVEYVYEFKKGYHYSIRNYDSSGKFEKISDPYDNLEIEQFKELLRSYASAASGAIAASVVDANQTQHNYQVKMLQGICSNLGVEIGGQKNYKSNNQSIFNKASSTPSSQFQQGSLEDL